MASATRFKQSILPKQIGELARIKVIQGPDAGSLFVITGRKALLGRGDECDIVLTDLKASRVHAEISVSATGWRIDDKGSANGITYNGAPVREAKLKTRDAIGLGETQFDFFLAEGDQGLLTAPARTASQMRNDKSRTESKQKELKGGSLLRAILVLALVFLGVSVFLTPKKPDDKAPLSLVTTSDSRVDLAAYLPQVEKNRTAQAILKEGMREYFSGNYSRARIEFETVLQISPSNMLAKMYLENCENSVKDAVKLHLETGKKALDSGKLREAKANFGRIQILLYRDQTNPAYVESKEQLKKINELVSEDKPNP